MRLPHFARMLLPVPIFPNKIRFKISPGVYISLCALLLIFPPKWVISWIAAAAIHELSHYVALRILAIRIYSIRINLFGARITAESAPVWKACIAVIAGPASGITLLLTAHHTPYLAICAFFQTCLNLIPVREFDGGRIINCFLRLVLPQTKAERISIQLEYASLVTLFCIGLYISVAYKSGILFPTVAAILILRRLKAKTPCKRSKQIVQCTQSSIRGTEHE